MQDVVVCSKCGAKVVIADYVSKLEARGWMGESCRLEQYATVSVGRVQSVTTYHRLRWNVSGFHGHKTRSICLPIRW